jgi:hypothetical protein
MLENFLQRVNKKIRPSLHVFLCIIIFVGGVLKEGNKKSRP